MMRYIAIAALSLLFAGSARGQDRFYAIIFAEQDERNSFVGAHSFATFAQVRLQGSGPEVVDRATISWLPAAGRVRLFKRAEPGRNYTLEESLAMVKPGHRLAQWGPFEIKEELFHRAKKQAAFLSSGGILYKAVDPLARPAGRAINCEHAISDIGLRPGESIVRTGTAHGHYGSYLVATHLRSWMIEPGVAHEWVNGSLGLGQYAIARGNWDYQGPARLEAPNIAVAAAKPLQPPTLTKVAVAQTVQPPTVTKVAEAETTLTKVAVAQTVQQPAVTKVAEAETVPPSATKVGESDTIQKPRMPSVAAGAR
jgi:hypothetical protein